MQISLTAKELICIAAATGALEILGIPDGFRDVSPRKLKKEVELVRQALEEKGVISSDFDGNSALNAMYLPIWETMFRCEKFVALDMQLAQKGQKGILFYVSGNRAVEAVFEHSGYTLRTLSAAECREKIVRCTNWVDDPAVLSCAPGSVKQSLLRKAKNAWSMRATGETLTKAGICEEIAMLVAKAFALGTNFYSCAFTDLTAGGKLQSLMFIDDAEGTLQLVPVIENDEDYVQLLPVTQAQIANALAVLAESVFGQAEVM